jgi:hypothetical protein
MSKAAAFLETRRYAAMLGATTEFEKEEGITFSKARMEVRDEHDLGMFALISSVSMYACFQPCMYVTLYLLYVSLFTDTACNLACIK